MRHDAGCRTEPLVYAAVLSEEVAAADGSLVKDAGAKWARIAAPGIGIDTPELLTLLPP